MTSANNDNDDWADNGDHDGEGATASTMNDDGDGATSDDGNDDGDSPTGDGMRR
jgi:hypothetical protein